MTPTTTPATGPVRGDPPGERANFARLWLGQSTSLLGTQISLLALPSIAILRLGVGPFALGALGAMSYAGLVLMGIPAGVAVDRWDRRRLMIATDGFRVLTLASIPAAAALGVLSLAQLLAVAAVNGVMHTVFIAAYQSYLPLLIGRERLVHGNARMEASRSGAQVAGPTVAGALIQAIGAPLAVLADAASFLVSAVATALVRTGSRSDRRVSEAVRFRDVGEGLTFIRRNATLRSLTGASATISLGFATADAVFLLFVYRSLHVSPVHVGALLAVGNVGLIVGVLAARRVSGRLRAEAAVAVAAVAAGAGFLSMPLALLWSPIPVLVVARFLIGLAIPIVNITIATTRQLVTPDHLQGRVNATSRTLGGACYRSATSSAGGSPAGPGSPPRSRSAVASWHWPPCGTGRRSAIPTVDRHSPQTSGDAWAASWDE